MENQVKRINPVSLATPNGFIHVAVAPPVPMVVISGQVSYDSHGNIVGVGDLEAQTRQVLVNLRTALQSIGLDFRHLVKLTFFVKGLNESAVAKIRKARQDFLVPEQLPTSTMVGVAALAKEDLLLEVEAWAAACD